jgi:hypothetical protein
MLNHHFDNPERHGRSWNRVYRTDLKPSRSIHEADIAAVQARYLEAHVRQRPIIDEEFLPKNENFSREHVIIGLFDEIMRILNQYVKADFKSQYYYLYPIGGLCKHVHLMPQAQHVTLKNMLIVVMAKYEFDDTQFKQCCKNMDFSLKDEVDSE